MDNDNSKYTVTSFNQQGGITAAQVNIGIKRERHISEKFKEDLKLYLPTKDQIVEISVIMNDAEAFHFANEIKNYLEKEGYTIEGIHPTLYAEPQVGTIVQPRKQGGLKIIIGVNPN